MSRRQVAAVTISEPGHFSCPRLFSASPHESPSPVFDVFILRLLSRGITSTARHLRANKSLSEPFGSSSEVIVAGFQPLCCSQRCRSSRAFSVESRHRRHTTKASSFLSSAAAVAPVAATGGGRPHRHAGSACRSSRRVAPVTRRSCAAPPFS